MVVINQIQLVLQTNIKKNKLKYNKINKKIMDGCKIIICTVETKSIIYIDETITDISGCNMEPVKLTDFFNKF